MALPQSAPAYYQVNGGLRRAPKLIKLLPGSGERATRSRYNRQGRREESNGDGHRKRDRGPFREAVRTSRKAGRGRSPDQGERQRRVRDPPVLQCQPILTGLRCCGPRTVLRPEAAPGASAAPGSCTPASPSSQSAGAFQPPGGREGRRGRAAELGGPAGLRTSRA